MFFFVLFPWSMIKTRGVLVLNVEEGCRKTLLTYVSCEISNAFMAVTVLRRWGGGPLLELRLYVRCSLHSASVARVLLPLLSRGAQDAFRMSRCHGCKHRFSISHSSSAACLPATRGICVCYQLIDTDVHTNVFVCAALELRLLH